MGELSLYVGFVGLMRLFLWIWLSLFAVQPSMASEPLLPVPEPEHLNVKQAALGNKLFHDSKLSVDGTISCASCHSLNRGGTDRLPHSFGVFGREGNINSPTVFNAALNFRQFWNGRALTLEEQIASPVTNTTEMGNTWENILAYVQSNASYQHDFSSLYSDGVTTKNIQHSIAEFERSLTLTNAPFDQYLLGDEQAISDEEKHGYQLFKDYGCVSCHQGAGVGGNMFQKFGVVGNYFKHHKLRVEDVDLGRFVLTHNPDDKHVFKVPSLRLVVLTAPYFHDGSAATLKEAIKIMAEYQLGRQIPDKDIASIQAFLATLVGEYQGEILK